MVKVKTMNEVAKNRSKKETQEPHSFYQISKETRPAHLLLQLKAYTEFITAKRPVLLGPIEVLLVVLDTGQTFKWSHDVNWTFTNTEE